MNSPRTSGVLRQNTLERRLFGWLLSLLLFPAMLLLAVLFFAGSRSVQLIGTLGPWTEVAQSGRTLFDAAAPAARTDTGLARALDVHQRNLSASLVEARRWTFLGDRALVALPWAVLVLALILAALSWWISRKIARELASPIEELVGWAALLGQGRPLPAAEGDALHEVSEVKALRTALRDAAEEIARAQARALEFERVRAWGEMARRIAHEMKNPLTPLRLAVHRLARSVPDAEQVREPMEVIEQETMRLDDMARQFAVLGRPSAGPRSEIDMTEMVTELMRSDVPPDIMTTIDTAGDVRLIRAHHDALQRTIRNLIRNAVDAIRTQSAQQGGQRDTWAGHINARITSSADGVKIEIEDNGGGVPEEGLARIFEPDYTLKAGGTGLGLAVVRQAIAAHRGTVSARNGASGAILEVWLPMGGDDSDSPDTDGMDGAPVHNDR